jgi:hypothetical protein
MDRKVSLGDIVTISSCKFERMDSLKDRNIDFDTFSNPGANSVDYRSEGVSINNISASGKTPNYNVGIRVSFRNQHECLLGLEDCTVEEIGNRTKLKRRILEAFGSDWDPEEATVVEVKKKKQSGMSS